MLTTDLMIKLAEILHHHGNLPIVGATMADDLPLTDVVVVDAEGRDGSQKTAGNPAGIMFIG